MRLETRIFDLHPRPPFDFSLALRYLRDSPGTILEVVTEDEYRRALVFSGKDLLVRACSIGSPEEPALRVTVCGDGVGGEEELAIQLWVRRVFSADEDLTDLYTSSRGDPTFASVARACYGLRPVLIPTLFETLAWAIIGQQINVAFAAKCKRALAERYGRRMVVQGRTYLLFPEPSRLALLTEADLTPLQFSRQKSRYVINLAREIVGERLDLDELQGVPAEEAQRRLEGLLGVGRWTAEYFLMRGLGHRDVIPAADGGLRRMIGQAYGLGRSATEEEVRALGENWAGWRSYAAFYWWYTLQQQQRAHRSNTRTEK